MRIMLTGATGFSGSHIARELQARGHTLSLLVRDREKLRAVFPDEFIRRCDVFEGDLNDVSSVEQAVASCDAVVHCAAMVSMHESDSDAMMHANLGGTQNVVGSAIVAGVNHIVYLSSVSTIYNSNGITVTENSPFAEVHNGYAKSKLEAEKWVRQQLAEQHPITIVYPTGITGPDDPGISSNNESFLYYLNNTTIDTEGGQQIVDVRDLAIAIRLMVERQALGTFIVGGHFLKWCELINTLESAVAKKVKTLHVPGWVLRALGQAVDLARRIVPFDTIFTGEAMRYATQAPFSSSDKLLTEFEFEFRPAEETLRDLVLWAAQEGHIESKWSENLSV